MMRTHHYPTGVAGLLTLGIAILGAPVSPAHAQWTVTNLHPAGSTESIAYAGNAGQQAGSTTIDELIHASLWNASADSLVDLNPAGATESVALGASAGHQVGDAFVGGINRASLWSGTAASWIDLHPAGAFVSFAFAVSSGQQAGTAVVGDVRHASLWTGTAASWIDLHPAGSTDSDAYATDGVQQAGFARVGGADHASLWNGTAASWVDLHPAGSVASIAHVTTGGQQAGFVAVAGFVHASLWSGTAASWTDLHPAGATSSIVLAASGGMQVGQTYVAEANHASLWSGTAASWVDLHALLPEDFVDSYAQGISHDSVSTYVTGYGFNGTTGRNEALLWTQPRSPNGIDYYQISKVSRFTQTSAAPPASVDSWRMIGFLQHTPDAVTSASISFDAPLPTTVLMTQGNPLLHLYYSDEFASRSSMDIAYPSTRYTFRLDRGAGTEAAEVFLPVDLFPAQIPHMTGDTFARLQSYDASLPFDLHINGFAPIPGANESHTTIQIVGGGVVFSMNVPNGATLVTIPAGTLLPATRQEILIEYSSSVETLNAGFGTARSYATFLRDTSAIFTTLTSCDSIDFNADGVFPDSQDITDFLNVFGGGACSNDPNCHDIDFNNDAVFPDSGDIEAFLTLFGGGAC